jgi:hypothetical protein
MGSQTFDFLTDSFLFRDALIQSQFSTVTELEIQQELTRYREFCLSKQSELEQEILVSQSNLNVISDVEMPDIGLLKQNAFYVNQHIINDPLFAIGYEESESKKVTNSYFGLDSKEIDKIMLTKIVTYVKQLRPMVVADYVKLLPVNFFLEPPEQLPVLYSENQFSDILPNSLIKFFRDNAVVNSLVREQDNPSLVRLEELKPSREIMIRFNDDGGRGYGYILPESKFELLDKQRGEFRVESTLPNYPPDLSTFKNWVNQSFNLSCKQAYDEVFERSLIANRLGASYLTESPFVFDLLSHLFSDKSDIPTNTANVLLNIELPFLEEIDISSLMEIRMNYGEEFQNFRLYLDKQFRDLRLVKDPNEFKLKAENALHELYNIQIQAINTKIGQIRKSAALDAVVLVGGLLAAFQSSPLSIAGLAAAGTAVARGCKPFVDYSSQVRQNPAFFLWQVLKKSQKITR